MSTVVTEFALLHDCSRYTCKHGDSPVMVDVGRERPTSRTINNHPAVVVSRTLTYSEWVEMTEKQPEPQRTSEAGGCANGPLWDAVYEAVIATRDAHPRLPDDAPSEEVVNAALGAVAAWLDRLPLGLRPSDVATEIRLQMDEPNA